MPWLSQRPPPSSVPADIVFDVLDWESSSVNNLLFHILWCSANPHEQNNSEVVLCLINTWMLSLTVGLFFSPLEEDEEEGKITLLQKKRNQLAGYCKLVIYGVLDLTAATDVFKHYDKVKGSQSYIISTHTRLWCLLTHHCVMEMCY